MTDVLEHSPPLTQLSEEEQLLRASVRAFAQAEIAVSTFYDERVVAALTEHDFAIRDSIVMELAESNGQELETGAGKKELAQRLRNSINQVLVEKTGFGGIDSIYFTKLVLQ